MTIEFHDAVDGDGLFDILGKVFHAIATINTARNTTVPTELQDVISQHNLLTVTADLERIATVLGSLPDSFKTVGDGTIQALVSYAGSLIIEFVAADNPQPDRQLLTALRELIRQMEANSQSVDASAVTVAVAADGDNSGNGVIVTSTKRGDGLVQENALAETIEVEATSDGLTASLRFLGEESVALLSAKWPRGSGANTNISATSAVSSLLANGDMEDEDDVADAPDDWIVSVGTIGTTIKMTDVEVQTVAITGTPTGGHYLLHWTDPDGNAHTTDPLAYNASASDVQTALREFPGLGSITISGSGTSPDLTHTITFTGKGGNLNQLTSTNNLTGGTSPTITHATTSAGTGSVFAGGKALELDSDGSQLTTINQRIDNLEPETAYAFSGSFLADVVPAAGVITIDLVDGIGGTVIQDADGTNNSFTFNAANLTTSFQHVSELVSGECVFRMPTVVPTAVYLRVRISTAVSAGTSVFVDHLALAKMQQIYDGGPLVAVFSGSDEFKKQDAWTITVTNDRAGLLHEWMNRALDMARLGLLLPSNSAGAETIPDTVVA